MIIGQSTSSNGRLAGGVEISYFLEDAVKANRANRSGIITDSDDNYKIKHAMTPMILQPILES